MNINRIEYIDSSKYISGAFQSIQLENKDYAVSIDHGNRGTPFFHSVEHESLLFYSTLQGYTYGIDLRCMKEAFQYRCEQRYGVPISLLVDNKRNWILGGTTRGVFQLYDIRFDKRLNTWAHPSLSPINSLEMDYTFDSLRGHGILAGTGGGYSEISAWNIESASCARVWCSLSGKNSVIDSSTDFAPGMELSRVYNESIDDIDAAIYHKHRLRSTGAKISSTRAIVLSEDPSLLFATGSDRKVRMWDLVDIESSIADIAGPSSGTDEPTPIYRYPRN